MRNNTLHSKLALLMTALLPLVLAVGCGSASGNGPDATAPRVKSTVPQNAAVGGSTNTSISATFSEAMTASSLTAITFTVTRGATPVVGTVTYKDKTALFVPMSDLAANTVYTATITTGAEDLAGNSLINQFEWTFTTGVAAGHDKKQKDTQNRRWAESPSSALPGSDIGRTVS